FGAVAALSTAWRSPEVYGRLLLQSGSFAFTDIGRKSARGPLFDPVVEFVNRFRSRPIPVAERLFVSCRMYESLSYDNRPLVLLLDAGDMFQGTVESNLGEGAAVVDVMNRLGYTAAAIGNHDFDFGPTGGDATPQQRGDDPRGALRARAAEARFPFLMANVVD